MLEATKILIVEDEVIVANDIKKRLSSLGYKVLGVAVTATQCMEKLKNHMPDIILMDIILKGSIDGIELSKRINEKYNIPIVFLTAHNDEQTFERAKISEPYGYILKPFEIRDLRNNIEIALYKFRMELKLKESEEKYRTLFNTFLEESPFSIRVFDKNGNLEYSNPAYQKIIEAKFDGLSSVDNIKDEKLLEKYGYLPDIMELFNRGGVLKTKPLYFDKFIDQGESGKNEILLVYHFYSVLNDNKEIFQVINFIEDVTDKLKAEEINSRLIEHKKFSMNYMDAIEKERIRIARELHDSVGQMLYAAKFNLEVFQKQNKIDEEKINLVKEQIFNINTELRNIIYSLNPISLTSDNFIKNVRTLCVTFSNVSKIKVNLFSEIEELKLNNSVELNLIRIIQEGLNNIHKHSSSKDAEVEICYTNKILNIKIKDFGNGFDKEKIKRTSGLNNIKERVSLLNGIFTIESDKKGTTLNIDIPMENIL